MGVYIINHGDDDDEAGIVSGNGSSPRVSQTPSLEDQRKWWDEHRRIAPALQVVVPTPTRDRPSHPFNKSGAAIRPATKRNPHYVI